MEQKNQQEINQLIKQVNSLLLSVGGILVVVLVMIVELLNTAIESALDRVGLQWHDLTKRAKDLGSAAVFLALLLCLATWAMALWSRFG